MTNQSNRFHNENLTLSDFYKEVLVVCLACQKKAIAKVNFETKSARLFCVSCGYNKETSITFKLILKLFWHVYFVLIVVITKNVLLN